VGGREGGREGGEGERGCKGVGRGWARREERSESGLQAQATAEEGHL